MTAAAAISAGFAVEITRVGDGELGSGSASAAAGNGVFGAALSLATAQVSTGEARGVRGDDEELEQDRARGKEGAGGAAGGGGGGAPMTIRMLNALLLVGDMPGRQLVERGGGDLGDLARRAGSEPSPARGDPRVNQGGGEPNAARQHLPGAADRSAAGETGELSHRGAPAAGRRAETVMQEPGPSAPATSTSRPAVERAAAAAEVHKRISAADARLAAVVRPVAAPGGDRASSPQQGSTIAVRGLAGSGPSARATATSAAATGPHGSARADAARQQAFAAQLARGLQSALARGEGSVTLRLAPQALGELRIELGIERGTLSATFQPTTAEARDLLQTTMQSLRAALEQRGLVVERLNIEPAAEAALDIEENRDAPAEPGDDGRSSRDGGQAARDGERMGGAHSSEDSEAESGDVLKGERRGASAQNRIDEPWPEVELILGIDTLA